MLKRVVLGGLVFVCLSALGFWPAKAQSLPDTLKILAIRVEFQPDNATTTTGDGTFDLSNSTTAFQIDPPPHNRSYFQDHLTFAKNYFEKVSRGALTVTGDVFPSGESDAYRLSESMLAYNPNTSAQAVDQGIARLLRDAIQLADADDQIDFSKYNTVVVFHAGVGRDIDLGLDDTPQDIPSLYVTSQFLQNNLGISEITVDGGATSIKNGIVLPETESQEGIQLGLNGILVSNIGSHLGFPDLFSPSERATGVGRFALMDAGLFNGDGLLPALPMAWTRIFAGWESATTIYQAQNDELALNAVLSPQSPHVFKFPINDNEYFLVENRYAGELRLDSLQLVLTEGRNELASMREVLETYLADQVTFSPRGVLIDAKNPDIALPGGGALIWHIDESVINAQIAQNRINDDPAHRGIDLEEADGSQDIGETFDFLSGIQDASLGWALDPWYTSNSSPLFENKFSSSSTPNSRSYLNKANSHITLSNFSASDSVVTFQATLDFFQPNFPRKIDPANYGVVTSLKVLDVNADGRSEMILTTDRNNILVIDETGESQWGTDSLEALQIDENLTLITPPAFTVFPNGDVRITILTREGQAFNYLFDRTQNRLNALISANGNGSRFSTFPVAPNEGSEIYWGGEDGNIWQLNVDENNVSFTEMGTIPEPVRFITVDAAGELLATGISGNIYNGSAQQVAEAVGSRTPLVGNGLVTVDDDGSVISVAAGVTSPESSILNVQSGLAAVTIPVTSSQPESEFIVAAGDNRISIFNENLTLRTEFPKTVYTPEISTDLFIAPLIGDLTDPLLQISTAKSSQQTPDISSIVAVDPSGLILGYDFDGNPLDDFPLAVGDSILVSPALLDIDGDGDVELASISKSGTIFVWDLNARMNAENPQPWAQEHATPGNTNRASAVAKTTQQTFSGLIPVDRAYNWPNPNRENYTFIRYYLTEAADVTIRIFDLAGDLVKELNGTGFANTDNEVLWDLTNVQSGVYLGQIEAKSSSKTESQIIKIAVVK
ncbi:MAG: T9SS type A sorting domain-containing protein [Calditrichia bacterium]